MFMELEHSSISHCATWWSCWRGGFFVKLSGTERFIELPCFSCKLPSLCSKILDLFANKQIISKEKYFSHKFYFYRQIRLRSAFLTHTSIMLLYDNLDLCLNKSRKLFLREKEYFIDYHACRFTEINVNIEQEAALSGGNLLLAKVKKGYKCHECLQNREEIHNDLRLKPYLYIMWSLSRFSYSFCYAALHFSIAQ